MKLLKRSTPLIQPQTIPPLNRQLQDPSSVFNPGGLRIGERDLLLLRVQDRGRRTHLLPVWHDLDGGLEFSFDAFDLSWVTELPFQVYHVYDPRITELDGRILVTLALDSYQGCLSALLDWTDLQQPRFLGLTGSEDLRNCVLFPQCFNGDYFRLSRPNQSAGSDGDPRSGQAIRLDRSRDLLEWEAVKEVALGRPHYWDEWIGPGPPPLLTEMGWLCVYHGVATHFAASNIYQAGLLLLDTQDPSRLLARSEMNILEPRLDWECVGQVPNVVFPTALTTRLSAAQSHSSDEEFLLYYGAADTVVGLCRGRIGDLLEGLDPVEGGA